MNYNNTFAKKHNIGAMLVWEMYNDKRSWVTGTRDFAIGLIPDLDYGDKTNQEASGKTQETAHAGLVGRLNYDFPIAILLSSISATMEPINSVKVAVGDFFQVCL